MYEYDPNSINACAREAERVYNEKTPPEVPSCSICGEDRFKLYNGVCADCLEGIYYEHEDEMKPFFEELTDEEEWEENFGSLSVDEVWLNRKDNFAWANLDAIALEDLWYLADYFKERGWI